ncbi:hypothetical protein L596_027012 [Steinernema carpocapsae]|uniref:Uncharacterized protein n=1 Tax=Steinernema carpocapsae TaxID=34508 RepID=A0A4U5M3Z0_STECR|nr:hypothetical protein L596_027012 [Steinernema carpocapsae]
MLPELPSVINLWMKPSNGLNWKRYRLRAQTSTSGTFFAYRLRFPPYLSPGRSAEIKRARALFAYAYKEYF